jgi:hypothetical protein
VGLAFTGAQHDFTSGAASSACAAGNQQHQPTGVTSMTAQKCTTTRRTQVIPALFARGRGLVKRLFEE